MNVLIPSPLFSYTHSRSRAEGHGRSLRELLADLDRQYPGLRFRIIDEQDHIRTHIRFCVNGAVVTALDAPLTEQDEVKVICLLSGG